MQFIQEYQELLDVHTNFFFKYGPIICKTVAYYPQTFINFVKLLSRSNLYYYLKLRDILPRFVKKEIIYEFTEGLLDVPLMIRTVMFTDSMIERYRMTEDEIFQDDVQDIVFYYLSRNQFQIEMDKILKVR